MMFSNLFKTILICSKKQLSLLKTGSMSIKNAKGFG